MGKPQKSNAAHTNRLIREASPYLLQHAHNPVDWFPWCSEAIEKAREEDKPIFLSIGYSACHWCHVMERESFEDEEIAEVLNTRFVSIKVDREERPDLDDIYMRTVQLMTGSGGWPLSIFLTPGLEPFFGGTYFPPRDLHGRIGFKSVLLGISKMWLQRRPELVANARQVTAIIREMAQTGADGADLDPAVIDRVVEKLATSFDPSSGGFGPAPKFPPASALVLLLRYHRRASAQPSAALHPPNRLMEMAEITLERMACGGIYDQIGGGFHRYSVDDLWLVPHFEKMLYDNALLTEAYLEAYQATGKPLYRRIAKETMDYVLRDMRAAGGGFCSSEDADSAGKEGVFYLWKRDDVAAICGADDAPIVLAYYDIRDAGNFTSHEPYHDGMNIPHVPRSPESVAREFGLSLSELETRLQRARQKLMSARNGRERPGRDDKILTAWNALMISALAKAYEILGEEPYLEAAVRAARFVLTEMTEDDALMRTYRDGRRRIPAFLEDYAFFSNALLDVYEAALDPEWFVEAQRIADSMLARFWDPQGGGFFTTEENEENLLVRMKPWYDGAEPSGNSMAASVLLRLHKYTGRREYLEKAERVLRAGLKAASDMPETVLKMLHVLDAYLNPAPEIVIVGPWGREDVRAMLDGVRSLYLPNKTIAHGDPTLAGEGRAPIPLLADKPMIDNRATAYVCRNFQCEPPITEVGRLIEVLQR